MILIVGGEGAGKRTYALSLGYKEEEISENLSDPCPVLDHLEKTVFQDPDCIDTIFPLLLEKKIVICNEVGSGVIPVEKTVRTGRENTGRLCILLAQKADAVIRMVCGIPMILKGNPDLKR